MYEFKHDIERSQFVAVGESGEAVLKYRAKDTNVWEFYSTYVPPELRKGRVGFNLVAYALESARAADKKILPTCWFVAKVMDMTHSYDDLDMR